MSLVESKISEKKGLFCLVHPPPPPNTIMDMQL